jgi:hypothetical protein
MDRSLQRDSTNPLWRLHIGNFCRTRFITDPDGFGKIKRVLGVIEISFVILSFFFGRPLKHLSQRGDVRMPKDLTFRRILNFREGILKVFLHLPPPLEGEI